MRITKLRINGKRLPDSPVKNEPDNLGLISSYLITGVTRSLAEAHEENITENNVVEFIFEDGTSWLSGQDTITDLFPESTVSTRSPDDAFELPPAIRNTGGTERGLLTDIAIKVVNFFVKKDIGISVKDAAEKFELKRLENRTGLYLIDRDFELMPLNNLESDKTYLLFLHGTCSSTKGSFEGLKPSALWDYIQQTYEGNVIGFEHKSLTQSPLDNVLDLAQKFPDNISFDIISHSRGGLLGDIICRFCNTDKNKRGFTADETDYLNKHERTQDAAQIEALKNLLANKNVFVKKFIRVACPAAGTVLASKRMDIYFNVVANVAGILTGTGGNPFYIAFKEFISTVIGTKNDPSVLPGLEAMNPESPFIKVLNDPSPDAYIDNLLAVISGNSTVHLNGMAVKVIAGKLFFLEKNDLVVNTGSMYMGTRRNGNIQYFFDDDSDVNHFNYFSNKKTSDAILQAFKAENSAAIPGFISIAQSSASQTLRGLEYGELFADNITGKRPVVILLPGIMGSNLSSEDEQIWINYLKFITGRLVDLKMPGGGKYSATSLIKTSYGKLKQFLNDNNYEVLTWPFDWRDSMKTAAAGFNNRVIKLLELNQPIKIIGHSMGGVLVRDFIAIYRDTWSRLNSSPQFQLIFLGAPLRGSFRIPYVLFGEDAIIKKLSLIDIKHSKKELLEVFSQMEGLLSLLPYDLIGGNDMADKTTWDDMEKAFSDNGWPTPAKDQLDKFRAYRDTVSIELDYGKAVYIAGKDKSTPLGYLIEESAGEKELVFLSTSEGDQSVTWESGIPKQILDKDSVYYVDVTHGALANEPSIFSGISEILSKGSTSLLSRLRPVTRGENTVFKTPQIHDFDISEEGITNTILGLENKNTEKDASELPLNICVSNGDLSYASYLILAGHFEGDGLLFAENIIDSNLNGMLSQKHRLGLYPGKIGTSDIFISPDDNFKGAVIVGLDKAGTLTGFQLALTVEQGACNYLLSLYNNPSIVKALFKNKRIGISSLIIGCGYGGLTIENSIISIITGVRNANRKINKLLGLNCPLIEEIEFVEKREDKALSCFYSVSRIINQQNASYNITRSQNTIRKLLGSARRMPGYSSEEWWTRITVSDITDKSEKNDCTKDEKNIVRELEFSISTGGAREEQQLLLSSINIVDELIQAISKNNMWSSSLAKTLFELIIPNEFKEQLKKQSNIVWILDKSTAGYPWELLQDTTGDAKPFSVNAGMIRQLSTDEYRQTINSVSKNNALIIAEPAGVKPDLPMAFEEGTQVEILLKSSGFTVEPALGKTAPDIIIAMFKDDYKIMHLAGHGVFDEACPEKSGMIIGKDTFLSPREIKQMSSVPELVFVNCCYLGEMGGDDALSNNRYKLAANLGTQLIENGVKAVVAAGWAVDDKAALEFTKVFYSSMLEGYNFGDSVSKARKYIFANYGLTNTWGAYQCYGDPFYKLRILEPAKKEETPVYVIAQEAEYDLYNLLNVIDTGKKTKEGSLEQLNKISQAVDKSNLRNAKITEYEALVYAELGEYKSALSKFESLLKLEKADFSFSSMEKYCNIRSKNFVVDFILSADPKPGYYAQINNVVKDLNLLINSGATAERYSLLASTYKRKSILAANETDRDESLKYAFDNYALANTIKTNSYKIYTLTNELEINRILVLYKVAQMGDSPDAAKSKALLDNEFSLLSGFDDDYWTIVCKVNIKLCLLLLEKNSTAEISRWNELTEDFQNIWKKAGSPGKKLAEAEHLQFLADALSKGKIKFNIKDVSYENIGTLVENVRQSLSDLINA
jgi:CHAT domain-containing protein/tetratricopeptide repeat protein/lecithin:cholesterol acyltransferase